MIICESALLTVLTALLAVCSYTDCTAGVIRNRRLVRAVIPAAALDALYYVRFAAPYRAVFAANFLILLLVALIFYAYHLWGAGDSKLLITAGLCLPGRFYVLWDSPLSSSFTIVIIVFSCAFLYVIGESVVLGIRNRDFWSVTAAQWDMRRFLASYFAMTGVLALLNILLASAFARLSPALAAAANFLLVLTLIQIRDKLPPVVIAWASVAVWLALVLLTFPHYAFWSAAFRWQSWLIVLCMTLLRAMAEKYNYRVIPTQEARAGQILSAGTVLSFSASRVRGLPTGRTEDLRSRLTAEEADAVRRWGTSAHGKPWIVTVRKMPFAIFIAVGFAAFACLEVMMR